jgi:hypothetical protein
MINRNSVGGKWCLDSLSDNSNKMIRKRRSDVVNLPRRLQKLYKSILILSNLWKKVGRVESWEGEVEIYTTYPLSDWERFSSISTNLERGNRNMEKIFLFEKNREIERSAKLKHFSSSSECDFDYFASGGIELGWCL